MALTTEQIDRVCTLRLCSYTPSEIAGRLAVPVAEVRTVLADAGLLTRPEPVVEPLGDRPRWAGDLVDLAEAAALLGVDRDTVRTWTTARALPYRDTLGLVCVEPFAARWCRFSRTELDRWIATQRIS